MSRGLTNRSRRGASYDDGIDRTTAGSDGTDDDGSASLPVRESIHQRISDDASNNSGVRAENGDGTQDLVSGEQSGIASASGASQQTDSGSGSDGRGTGKRTGRGSYREFAAAKRRAATGESDESSPVLSRRVTEPPSGPKEPPKETPYPPVSKNRSEQKKTVDLIQNGYEALFYLLSMGLGKWWILDDDEETEQLAEKTREFVDKLGSKRAKAVMTLLDGPVFSLLIMLSLLLAVIIPRVQKTQAARRALQPNQPNQPNQTKRPTTAGQPATRAPENNYSGIDERLRPATATDIERATSEDIEILK